MKDLTKLEEQVAEEIVAPTILKLLKPFSASDITLAINENIDLAKGLQQDTEYLSHLKLLTLGIPFTDEFAKKVKQKKWIRWFINNTLKHKRKDLYNQIVYHPQGLKYITRQIRRIVKLIFP